jgi:threonine synthase
MNAVHQRCIRPTCAATCDVAETAFVCPRCGGLLDVAYDWDRLPAPKALSDFEAKWSQRSDPLAFSGVWRFRELLPFADPAHVMTVGEGQTILQKADGVAPFVGLKPGNLFLQYEGMNPSGSFKDNGMTAAFTHAHMIGARRAACASTGNTSASLAVFCSATGLMKAIVFIGSGKIAYGKLAQALDHGALTVQIAGDFDDAMQRVREVAGRLGIYLVNSINPFRLEGQKTIMFRVLEALRWQPPDWIIVPGGNLGNVSAFGKAFMELREIGLLEKLPRLAVINAAGANTFYQLYEKFGLRWNAGDPDASISEGYFRGLAAENVRAATIASVVREVTDQEILDAKAKVGAGGLGCEPASAASVAGARVLVREGVIGADERVVCILTGHQLKDPNATVAYHSTDQKLFEEVLGKRGVRRATFANRAVQVANDLDEIIRAIELYS